MAKLYPFSEQTRQLLENIPQQGETHHWLARVAGGLRHILPKDGCIEFLRSVCDDLVSHRLVPDREIADAVELAYGEGAGSVNTGLGGQRWPEKDEALVADLIRKTSPLFDVERDTGLSAADTLMGLFLLGELVCAGVSSDKPRIRRVEDWRGDAEKMQLICVNPMRGEYGRNKGGGLSIRCQNNVRLRRYLVAEFDDKARGKADQACLISALARMVPLVMVVDSGGKSLHAWFRVEGLGSKDQVRFFAACCAVGADPTRWDICGWLRMPGGWRPVKRLSQRHGDTEGDGGRRQRILYFANRTSNIERQTSNVEGKTPCARADAEIGGPVGKAGER